MQRLTNWLERRRSASRTRPPPQVKPAQLTPQRAPLQSRTQFCAAKNDLDTEQQTGGFLAKFRDSTRETRARNTAENFARLKPMHSSMIMGASTEARQAPPGRLRRILPLSPKQSGGLMRMSSSLAPSSGYISSSSSSEEELDYCGDARDYGFTQQLASPFYSRQSVKHGQMDSFSESTDTTLIRKQIRTNPWLPSAIKCQNVGDKCWRQVGVDTKIDRNKARRIQYSSCTCAPAATLDYANTLSELGSYSGQESIHSKISSLTLNSMRNSASSSLNSSAYSAHLLEVHGASDVSPRFTQMLNSSTCSSGYGSQDNSPECSMHSPDWNVTSVQPTVLPEERGNSEITVELAGQISAAKFFPNYWPNAENVHKPRGQADYDNLDQVQNQEHIYHELENNRFMIRMQKDSLYAKILRSSSGSSIGSASIGASEPVYAVPYQDFLNRQVGNFCGDSDLYMSPFSDSFHEDYRNNNGNRWTAPINYNNDSRRFEYNNRDTVYFGDTENEMDDSDYEDINVEMVELNGDKAELEELQGIVARNPNKDSQKQYEQELGPVANPAWHCKLPDRDQELERDQEMEECSLTSSSTTSCSSWTPMLRTSEAKKSQRIEGSTQPGMHHDSTSVMSVTTFRKLPQYQASPMSSHVTRQKHDCHWRKLPNLSELNVLAELDQQIVELQLQSDAVRGLVEAAKARHAIRSRTRQLCMKHLQNLRALRCEMHNHFELCI